MELPNDIFNTPHDYRLVETQEDLLILLLKLQHQKVFCFDTETTGIDAHNCDILGLAISFEVHTGYYVPLLEGNKNSRQVLSQFKTIFSDSSIIKVAHNIKYDMLVLNRYGIDVQGQLFDTMIADFCLNPEETHKMDDVALKYLNYSPIPIASLIGKKGKNQKNMSELPVQQVKEYAVEDADITLQLYYQLNRFIQKTNLSEIFYKVDMLLVPVIFEMEKSGVTVDEKRLKELQVDYSNKLTVLEKQIYSLVGRTFNLNSPKQKSEVLFDELNIPNENKRLKSGYYSTSKEVLVDMKEKHPVLELLVEYNRVSKLKNTFIVGLLNAVSLTTGKVHTSFNQCTAGTGRLTSSKPNLQNIPNDKENDGIVLRECFIPSDANKVIMAADFSQIELRLAAEISEEPTLIDVFNKGGDVHQRTAALMFSQPLESVSDIDRGKAKAINFGLIYGMHQTTLAKRLKVDEVEAFDLIETYFSTYPEIKTYQKASVLKARRSGFSSTLLGRRRRLPNLKSRNWVLKGAAERQAINTPIQGTAADLIKLAMIDVHNEMKRLKLSSKMLLQVHDELVFEVPLDESEIMKKLLYDKMENAMPSSVPMEVKIGTGKNWREAH